MQKWSDAKMCALVNVFSMKENELWIISDCWSLLNAFGFEIEQVPVYFFTGILWKAVVLFRSYVAFTLPLLLSLPLHKLD